LRVNKAGLCDAGLTKTATHVLPDFDPASMLMLKPKMDPGSHTLTCQLAGIVN
jgi:hypothetical protein